MTYASFHLFFTIPIFLLALILNFKNPRLREKKSWLAAGTLLLLAFAYTTPWDSYLIHSSVWSYSEARVLGTLFKIPYEEYFFFFIQTLTGCLLTAKVLQWDKGNPSPHAPSKVDKFFVILFSAALVLPVIYAPLFVLEPNPYRYFFLVAGWGAPIILLQWSLGYRILLRSKAKLFGVVAPLTAYLWIADWYAIQQGIWFFPGKQISGIYLFSNLPIEEALFFLFTNLMVVQGFILFTGFNKKELPVKLGGHPY